MSQYSIFQAFYLSFFSKKLYRDVANNWGGKAFLYLLALLAAICLVFTYQIQYALTNYFKPATINILSQVPNLTIKNGILSTPEERPYEILDAKTNQLIGIIDTTGKYTKLDQTGALLLVTQDQVITRFNNETRIKSIPNDTNIIYNTADVTSVVNKFFNYAWIFVYFILLLHLYVGFLLKSLIYSLFGLIFAAIMKIRLSYVQIFLMSFVTLTPAILFGTLMFASGYVYPITLLIAFMMAFGYLFYGILANKN